MPTYVGLITGQSSNGATNNTTPVTIVAAPSSGVYRQVKWINVYNADTASATVTIKLVTSGGSTTTIGVVTLSAGSNYTTDTAEHYWLNSNQTITIVLSGSITTNQLQWTTSSGDFG
jgi:hypothetical protein